MQFVLKHEAQSMNSSVSARLDWANQVSVRDFIPFNLSEVMMNDLASSLQFCYTYRMKEEPLDWRSQYSVQDGSSHGC